eukprot:COSAG05_NODE_2141_length_3486_cov_4.423679_1_plen_198_part_00
MAAAFDFVEGSVHEFDLPDLDKAFQRMEAASVMIRELQDMRSPHRGATPPTDATAIAKHLVAAAVAQTRLRHNACASVLDNLRYCKANGLTYDPLRSYAKGDTTPGPDSRKKKSPGSTKRARTALKEAGNLEGPPNLYRISTCRVTTHKEAAAEAIRATVTYLTAVQHTGSYGLESKPTKHRSSNKARSVRTRAVCL